MSSRILAANAFWSLLSHLLSRGSLMVSAIVLARALDPSSFAAYSYFSLTVSMLAAYAAMGMGATASRFFAEVGHEIEGKAPPPLGTLCLMSVLLSFAALVVVLLAPSHLLQGGLAVPNWAIAIGVFFMTLRVVPAGAILGLERYRQATIISTASGITMLAGAWWAAREGDPLVGMMVIVATTLLQAVGESVIVIRVIGWVRLVGDFRVRSLDIQRVLSMAGPMFLVSLLSASGSWLLGRMILRGGDGEHAFALYSIGLQWFSLALVLPGMVSRVILPRLVRQASSTSNGDAGKVLARQGAVISALAAAGVAGVGVVIGPQLAQIYGSHYQEGHWFIAAFMGAALLSAPANTVGNAIVANEGQRVWLALTAVWLIVLLVNGAVTVEWGAWSGAFAQAMAAATLTVLSIATARARKLV